eukprot:5252790-Amphidinium_carterae.1
MDYQKPSTPRGQDKTRKDMAGTFGTVAGAGSTTSASELSVLLANTLEGMPKSRRQVDLLQSLDHRLESQDLRLHRQGNRLQEADPMVPQLRTAS